MASPEERNQNGGQSIDWEKYFGKIDLWAVEPIVVASKRGELSDTKKTEIKSWLMPWAVEFEGSDNSSDIAPAYFRAAGMVVGGMLERYYEERKVDKEMQERGEEIFGRGQKMFKEIFLLPDPELNVPYMEFIIDGFKDRLKRNGRDGEFNLEVEKWFRYFFTEEIEEVERECEEILKGERDFRQEEGLRRIQEKLNFDEVEVDGEGLLVETIVELSRGEEDKW